MPIVKQRKETQMYLAEEYKKEFDKKMKTAVVGAKPSVDCRAPEPLPLLENNENLRWQRNNRQQQIDHDNECLLRNIEYQYTMGKSIDCHLKQEGPRSLIKDAREKELKRITEENMKIYNAVIEQKPVIDYGKFEHDYQAHKYSVVLHANHPDLVKKRDAAWSQARKLVNGEINADEIINPVSQFQIQAIKDGDNPFEMVKKYGRPTYETNYEALAIPELDRINKDKVEKDLRKMTEKVDTTKTVRTVDQWNGKGVFITEQ